MKTQAKKPTKDNVFNDNLTQDNDLNQTQE